MLSDNKKQHRHRKNPSARDAWMKRKHEINAARGRQVLNDFGFYIRIPREA